MNVVNPIVLVTNNPNSSKIVIEGYVSEDYPSKYWRSDNGVAAISNVEYDYQNPMDFLSYIIQKYNAPNGWTIESLGFSEASTIELSGTL
jgi:hypothetical protein